MAETGEKYTVARRMVMAAAQEGAIRGAVQESLERLVGLSTVDVDLAADRVHVTIRAARPGLAWGLLRPAETEGVWRDTAAERLRGELEELTCDWTSCRWLRAPYRSCRYQVACATSSRKASTSVMTYPGRIRVMLKRTSRSSDRSSWP